MQSKETCKVLLIIAQDKYGRSPYRLALESWNGGIPRVYRRPLALCAGGHVSAGKHQGITVEDILSIDEKLADIWRVSELFTRTK